MPSEKPQVDLKLLIQLDNPRIAGCIFEINRDRLVFGRDFAAESMAYEGVSIKLGVLARDISFPA